MRLLWNDPDGGKDSNSRMWGLEVKALFSVLLLSFDGESRDAYHTHAFNSWSVLLSGYLLEQLFSGAGRSYTPFGCVIRTRRETFHQVHSPYGRSWVLTWRGPWLDTWREFLPRLGKYVRLTHGRKVLSE